MLRKMTMLLFAILVNYATAVIAGDYVLDASTMGVGATAGENLVVKEGCLDPSKTSCTEKIQWLTTTSPAKVGNVQIVGGLSGNFEVVVTADFAFSPKAINLLTADNKGIAVKFNGDGSDYYFEPNGIGEGGDYEGGAFTNPLLGWNGDYAFNEVKIRVQNGIVNVYTNGTALRKPVIFDAGVVFERATLEGIKSDDRLSDVKVRGIQGSTTCGSTSTTPSTPTSSGGDCTADYGANGSLHVPCVRVPGTFGKMELYDVWMQQRFPAYAFDLNLNRVTPK